MRPYTKMRRFGLYDRVFERHEAGSTHHSQVRDVVERSEKRRARQEAKREIRKELTACG